MSDGNVIRMAVDTGDVDESKVLRHINRVLSDTEEAPPQSFRSMKELLAREADDLDGDFIPFPDLDGMEVHVTGAMEVRTQFNKAEERYRKRKGLGTKATLPTSATVKIAAEAYFDGHGVKDWRFADGSQDAVDWPWTREKFIELFRLSWRFRDFIESNWTRLSGLSRKLQEGVQGE